jgi:RNA polymerase sigma-70 factor, ECF subfamily
MTRENVATMREDGGREPAGDPPSAEAALARGDYRAALAVCATEHGAGLGRLCMALTGSQAEADELVHETLLLAYDGFASFRGEGTLRAWLFGIARRVCARHLETRTRQAARLRLVHPPPFSEAPEAEAISRQRAEQARRALAELKPSERDALVLRYGAELSFREVASACGVDEPTARKRVSRALGRLREQLAEDRRPEGRSTEESLSAGTREEEEKSDARK